MASVVYKNYLISARSSFHGGTGCWTMCVDISWSSGRNADYKLLACPDDFFKSKSEAEWAGIQMGKEWVDDQRRSKVKLSREKTTRVRR